MAEMHDDVKLIIDKVLEGDTTAFKELVVQFSSFAFNISFQILNKREDAEEVVQDSFVKIYKHLKSYRGDSKFSTWLYRIVYRESLNRLKKNRSAFETKTEQIGDSEISGSYSNPNNAWAELKLWQQQKYIREALEAMPQNYAMVIRLYYLQELSLKEICEVIGIELPACKVRLHRGRKLIFKNLQESLKGEIRNLL